MVAAARGISRINVSRFRLRSDSSFVRGHELAWRMYRRVRDVRCCYLFFDVRGRRWAKRPALCYRAQRCAITTFGVPSSRRVLVWLNDGLLDRDIAATVGCPVVWLSLSRDNVVHGRAAKALRAQ